MLKIKKQPNTIVAALNRAHAETERIAEGFSCRYSVNEFTRRRRHSQTSNLVHAAFLLLALVLGSVHAAAHEAGGSITNGVNGGITNGVNGSITNDLSARFEIEFLQTTIDHHFASLRMTELAAGTDPTRDAELSPDEGTSPTPGTNTTPATAKATLDEIKSLARQSNRTGREKILNAQRLLQEWYGIVHEPQISEINQARIQILEVTPAGDEFNHAFLEVFSRHQFTITLRAVEANTSSNLDHEAIRRMARNILETHMNGINEMRELLCREFEICDFQPYVGVKGKHTGDEEELDPSFGQFDAITTDEDEDGGKHLADPTSNDDPNGSPDEVPVDPVDPGRPPVVQLPQPGI